MLRGIRQRESLSSKNRIGDKEIKILSEDAVVYPENEDNLQRLLNTFNLTRKKYNMSTSAEKTKFMSQVDNQVIQPKLRFKYLGIDTTSYGNI